MFVGFIICKYFLLDYSLSFNSLSSVFLEARNLNFDEIQVTIYRISKIKLCFQCRRTLCLKFSFIITSFVISVKLLSETAIQLLLTFVVEILWIDFLFYYLGPPR